MVYHASQLYQENSTEMVVSIYEAGDDDDGAGEAGTVPFVNIPRTPGQDQATCAGSERRYTAISFSGVEIPQVWLRVLSQSWFCGNTRARSSSPYHTTVTGSG